MVSSAITHVFPTRMYHRPSEFTMPRLNPEADRGLGVTRMCQCWLLSFTKFTTLVEDVGNQGSCAQGTSTGQVYVKSLPFPQFSY